jgi:hypothetical protein
MQLPTSVIDRIVFAVVCVILLAVSSFACIALNTTVDPPRTIPGWCFHVVIEAVFFGLFVFSGSGLLWCLTRASWAEHLFLQSESRLVIPLAIFCLVSVPFVFWAMWMGF